MDKLSKSLEVLKLLSTTTTLETLIIKGNNENYFKLITAIVETLFTTCNENDYDNLQKPKLTTIQVELHRIIKRNLNVGPRGTLKNAL
ncbi:unnamed protein product [Rotaria sordida]|uniref:Uncharacterized protein n=1 Tax=Rotaria sordida TaxID=392033 RepID=A0A814GJB4_9BILA|nr:unnamed protein product [Rotaria sordida]CAF1034930.1 unnamed protein product [Rotaria sordida]CAF3723859.1 unnamed protein product [Rotaria sordida]CAF3852510.1 unnamed protein product [Rotaria sordida]CAF3949921.1 unnamed protein product [Rotaria sordida]